MLQPFEQNVANHRERLLAHPIYQSIADLNSVREFMKLHVFAVWDFMSLLKSLQRQLTCVDLPWMPSQNPEAARFINEIVIAEESDALPDGTHLSHFELYLRAMNEVGADTGPVMKFIEEVRASEDPTRMITRRANEGGVFAFMDSTFKLVHGEPHETAAAFLYGREDIIPDMFTHILKSLNLFYDEKYHNFRFYLERHIEVDGGEHGPLARKMLAALCGDSELKWRQAEAAAIASLEARIKLWDFLYANSLACARPTPECTTQMS